MLAQPADLDRFGDRLFGDRQIALCPDAALADACDFLARIVDDFTPILGKPGHINHGHVQNTDKFQDVLNIV